MAFFFRPKPGARGVFFSFPVCCQPSIGVSERCGKRTGKLADKSKPRALGVFFYFRGEVPGGLLPRILALFYTPSLPMLLPFHLDLSYFEAGRPESCVCFISSCEPLSFCYILGEYRIYPKPPKPHLKISIVLKSNAACASYELGVRLLLISVLHGVEVTPPFVFSHRLIGARIKRTGRRYCDQAKTPMALRHRYNKPFPGMIRSPRLASLL